MMDAVTKFKEICNHGLFMAVCPDPAVEYRLIRLPNECGEPIDQKMVDRAIRSLESELRIEQTLMGNWTLLKTGVQKPASRRTSA
jgi:hypothetical protein